MAQCRKACIEEKEKYVPQKTRYLMKVKQKTLLGQKKDNRLNWRKTDDKKKNKPIEWRID